MAIISFMDFLKSRIKNNKATDIEKKIYNDFFKSKVKNNNKDQKI